MPASVTTSDGDQALVDTISLTPSSDSYVKVSVNGALISVGNGVKTEDCYFSGDSGTTARDLTDIEAGDTLHWNGSIIGYQLSADDKISFYYHTTSVSTLLTSLVSFWKLEESSGTRVDAVTHQGNDLTDNNTVTQATGKIGNAAQCTAANSEFLSISDNSSLRLSTGGTGFTIAGWVYADSLTHNTGWLGKWDSGASDELEYACQYFTSGPGPRFAFSMYDGVSQFILRANTFGVPSTATWYFICCGYDNVNDELFISVNNGTQDTLSFGGGTSPTGTATLYIGKYTTAATHWDGRIDAVGLWKRTLSATEITELYNAGSGVEYPF